MMEQHAREYLLQIPFWTKQKHTISQVQELLTALGDPDRRLRIIHVAGTNGKGSVCADLTAVLTEAGYHVGTFVSPHLEDITERFLYDGRPISEADLEQSFQAVLTVTETMRERGFFHPTFFEFVFLMAMELYGRLRPDYVVLETGLGGRLDATNAVRDPIACVITSISLEHTQYLGTTIREIAGEKAGILKPGAPVIYDAGDPDASQVIRERAGSLGIPAWPVSPSEPYDQVPFAAPWQAVDAALAVKCLKVLEPAGVDEAVIRRGLSKVSWPGRMQEARPGVWLDGAHNPGGIRAFVEAVKGQLAAGCGGEKPEGGGTPVSGGVHLLFAAVADKDYREMIRLLCQGLPLERVTVVQLHSERGLAAETLKEAFQEEGVGAAEQFAAVPEALDWALAHKREPDRLYVVGSLYLIGEIRAELARRKP